MALKRLNEDQKPLPDSVLALKCASNFYWGDEIAHGAKRNWLTAVKFRDLVVQTLHRFRDYSPFSHEKIELFFILNISISCDKIAPSSLAEWPRCMSVSCAQRSPPSTVASRLMSFSSSSLPPSLFQSKSSNFPASHWQWRGHIHTRCSLTPERQRWGVPVVSVFCCWRKRVVKCHQPCVQWTAFQETTTTLKPQNNRLKKLYYIVYSSVCFYFS